MKTRRSARMGAFGAALIGLCTASACRTLPTMEAEDPGSPWIGRPVEAILQRDAGLRAEFFDAAGSPVPRRIPGEAGSVSIHRPEGENGQDNFAFDEDGIIIRHQRSYGEAYPRGVWEDARQPNGP